MEVCITPTAPTPEEKANCPLSAAIFAQTRGALGGIALAAEQEKRIALAVGDFVAELQLTPPGKREALINQAFNNLLEQRQLEIEIARVGLALRQKIKPVFDFLAWPIKKIKKSLTLLKEQCRALRQIGTAKFCSTAMSKAIEWLNRQKSQGVFFLPLIMPVYALVLQQNAGLALATAAKLTVSLIVLNNLHSAV